MPAPICAEYGSLEPQPPHMYEPGWNVSMLPQAQREGTPAGKTKVKGPEEQFSRKGPWAENPGGKGPQTENPGQGPLDRECKRRGRRIETRR